MSDDTLDPQQSVPRRTVGRPVLTPEQQAANAHANTQRPTRRPGHAVLAPGRPAAPANAARTVRQPGRAVLPTTSRPVAEPTPAAPVAPDHERTA